MYPFRYNRTLLYSNFNWNIWGFQVTYLNQVFRHNRDRYNGSYVTIFRRHIKVMTLRTLKAFHYTQAIWIKPQKCGLTSRYRGNSELGSFVKKIMAIPFPPADLIIPTHSLLKIPALQHSQTTKIETFFTYYKKKWLKLVLKRFQFLVWKM